MTYELHLEIRDGYLFAHPVGMRTRASVSSMTAEISKACMENHCSRVMIDVRELEGRLRTLESFFIVTEEFPRLRGKGLRRAAVIDRQISRARGWFFETVARNRDFNLRIFTDGDAAHEWLIGSGEGKNDFSGEGS